MSRPHPHTGWQYSLDSKNVATRGQEARLYLAMFASLLFPVAMYMYAWCTFPSVPWIALTIAITVSWSDFSYLRCRSDDMLSYSCGQHSLYTSAYSITLQIGKPSSQTCKWFCPSLNDSRSYGPFASSALAGQALCRMSFLSYLWSGHSDYCRAPGNTTSTTFPLFTQQMYSALTYKWANTIFALIATLMIPIPFVRTAYNRCLLSRHPLKSISFRCCISMDHRFVLEANSHRRLCIVINRDLPDVCYGLYM